MLGIFADHTVYLAFYEGGAPSNEIFSVAEDGSISFAEDFDGVQALFTLPLDAGLADPAAADAFAESTGLNIWGGEAADGSSVTTTETQENDGTDDTAQYGSYTIIEDGGEIPTLVQEGKTITVDPDGVPAGDNP